jgi:hypothetical protein
MKDMPEHLENREATLLLYVADELGPQDRAALELRLSREPDLRADLEQLRAALTSASDAIHRLDELSPPPVSDSATIRKATRMIREWQGQRLQSVRQESVVERSLRFPWWTYPLATAAAVVLALFVWWTNLDNLAVIRTTSTFEQSREWPMVGAPGFVRGQGFGLGLGSLAPQDFDDLPVNEEALARSLEHSFDNGESLLEEAVAGDHLQRAENEILTLWDRRSDFPDTLFVSDTDQ